MELLGKAEAVEAGHLHVEQHNRGMIAVYRLQRLDAVRGSRDRVPLQLEEERERFEDIRVVVHDQYGMLVHRPGPT